jgi:protein TonB
VSNQKLGFIFSVLLHLLLLPLLFYINKPISQKSKSIALNFELNSILIEGEEDDDTIIENASDEAPDPTDKVQEIKSVVEEEPPPEEVTEVVKEEEAAPVEEVQEVNNAVEEALPEKMEEIAKKVESDPVYTKSVTKQVVNEKHDELRETSKPESASEKVTQNYVNQYIREHFDYINKSVRLNISYPRRARKMLMEGRVIVSFVVRLDGSIKDIIIKQSSGHSILDKNVIRSVKKAVPFPPPPVEAKVIIPITYRLGT